MTRNLSTAALAMLLTACRTGPDINTISIPESAIAERVVPKRHGTSNLDVGVYANECAAALDDREKDIQSIRKAVGQ